VAALSAAELVRHRVEHALAAGEVDLTTPAGRERAEQLIDDTLRALKAELISGDHTPGSIEELERAGRQLRDELVKAYGFVMPQRPGLQP